MKTSKRKQARELRVVLDTNAVYTGSASYLVRKELADLIREHRTHLDLSLAWYLPEIVRHERQYQMLEQAVSFMVTIEKLERLLGHNLNITAGILEARVEEAIQRQVAELGLIVHSLDTAVVDWQRLMLSAARRKPPFDPGEREKGFRDALVLETFDQIVAASPVTPTACRVVLVTGDRLLTEAVTGRMTGRSNTQVLASPDELKGLINTLVSQVDEEFINSIRDDASKMFFVSKDDNSLYYREKLGSQVRELVDQSVAPPTGADQVATDRVTIANPRFVRKEKQRVYWSTRIEIHLKGTRSPFPATISYTGLDVASVPNLGLGPQSNLWIHNPGQSVILSGTYKPKLPVVGSLLTTQKPPEGGVASLSSWPEDQVVATGIASVEVIWSVAVSTARRLTKPQLHDLSFVDVVWT